jgi:hypothetical protein
MIFINDGVVSESICPHIHITQIIIEELNSFYKIIYYFAYPGYTKKNNKNFPITLPNIFYFLNCNVKLQ